MERLTYWNEEYGCWSYHCGSGEAANRLAAYEDTGLMPENVEALKLSAMGKAIAEITEFDGLPIDRLRERRIPAQRDGNRCRFCGQCGQAIDWDGDAGEEAE